VIQNLKKRKDAFKPGMIKETEVKLNVKKVYEKTYRKEECD
jgi:hypothetical protein